MLDKVSLKAGIEALLTDMETRNENAKSDFASELANLIDTFVKTGTVNVTVSTTGTATAQTGTGIGSIT